MKNPLPKWLIILLMAAGALIALGILFRIMGQPLTSRTGLKQTASSNASEASGAMPLEDRAFGIPADMKGLAVMDTDEGEMMMESVMAPAPSVPPVTGGSAAVGLDGEEIAARIIKNGDLRLRVEDATAAMDSVRTIVSEKNGFVESSSISDSGEGPRTARMTLRVPVDSFEPVLNELKGLSVLVLYESTGAQDVTSEFVDLEADLRNAKAEEDSYRAILDRSGSIEEVLSVTRALADVRGRIERLEARKRYMESRTDLSTISLTLTEETRIEVPTKKWTPIEVVRQSVRDLVIGLQAFVDFLIQFVISVIGLLIPVAAFVALVIWLGWKIIRGFVKRMKK
jgi:hypothetical protein